MRSLLFFSGCCALEAPCVPSEWSFCFPQSGGIPAIKSHLSSRPDFLGAHQFILLLQDPQAGESQFWGSELLLLWENFCGITVFHSGFWVAHLVCMGFDFIMIVPLLLPSCGLFVFGRRVSFLAGSSVFLVHRCSSVSCDLGFWRKR